MTELVTTLYVRVHEGDVQIRDGWMVGLADGWERLDYIELAGPFEDVHQVVRRGGEELDTQCVGRFAPCRVVGTGGLDVTDRITPELWDQMDPRYKREGVTA